MADCIFCKIIAGEIPGTKIWEDEDFLAFLDINPMNPGHTLLIPKRHQEYLFEVEEPLYSKIFDAAKKLSGPIKRAMGAKRIGVVVEGFLVPHVHIHLVPLHSGGELSFGRSKKATPEELQETAEKIKNEM
jgi:histidine triad (HIT) family protein